MGHILSVASMVFLATVLLVVMAILVLVADDRVKKISGYSTNSNLASAHSKLVWAQALAWIAAGLALLLSLGYVALHIIDTSEWLHLILWILTFAALIASGVFLAIALSDIDKAGVSDNQGTTGYIWGALITGAVALLVLLISGGWRVAHKQFENTFNDQLFVAAADGGVPTGAAEMPPMGQQPQIQIATQPGAVPAQI